MASNPFQIPPEDNVDQSIAQAQSLIMNYFSRLTQMPESTLSFYSRDATLTWNLKDYRGIEEIRAFLETLKTQKLEFQIGGYDSQNCPDHSTDNISMILIIGTFVCDSTISDFHSTFFLRYNHQERKAVIQYQTFQAL